MNLAKITYNLWWALGITLFCTGITKSWPGLMIVGGVIFLSWFLTVILVLLGVIK